MDQFTHTNMSGKLAIGTTDLRSVYAAGVRPWFDARMGDAGHPNAEDRISHTSHTPPGGAIG